ncbi:MULTISPECIES: DUF1579 domain-containing protein [Leeia]|uniref:DUF1579 domain-containing protein n=1 Tax=Leeia aquatica TaxID=2725557 RepID=A0A847RSJ4_9NEIS|nr:DUF1579 domain-containing protein [Leeia aquatica]NLR74180.1 DUF1579 domain-containing protein [Leeia aquatica]
MSSSTDFDFFMGRWNIQHQRLKERLANCQEWDHFHGSSHAQHILGGMGNIDDNYLEMPGGAYRAITLRSFDPATRQWSIWWLDGRFPGTLDAPMRGSFENGVGCFLADDVFQGRDIKVRFLWYPAKDGTPRWEQAFSVDNGQTWETNWIMIFHPAGEGSAQPV